MERLAAVAPDIPRPDKDWHPTARMLWDRALSSGQSRWYQDTDWAMLYHVCEEMSRYKNAGSRNAQMLATIHSMMSDLLISEGSRRRVRIETARGGDDGPDAEAFVRHAKLVFGEVVE